MIPGTHGSTFGGNPLAMRTAEVVLKLITKKGFLESLKEKIEYLDEKIKNLITKNNDLDLFKNAKGGGMLRGIELSDKITVGEFSSIARKKGLLLVGAAENTIRILPPLNTSIKEIDLAFKILEDISLGYVKNNA